MSVQAGVASPHDHVVSIYDGLDELARNVSDFLGQGLDTDGAAVVIATPAHREAIATRLSEHGLDLAALTAAGRYRALDAAQTLASFTIDGALDRARFAEVIGEVIAAASAGGRSVRAFGEMVALLWADGDPAAAIELEAMWNELAQSHRFLLYCAYPRDMLAGADDLVRLQQVCAHHSEIVAPDSYTAAQPELGPSADPDSDSRTYLPVPSAVSAARRFVTGRLGEWQHGPAVIDDAALVVSELAANAVAHAHTAFRIRLSQTEGMVKIEAEDLSPRRPVLGTDRGSAVGGRGLILIAALGSRWGSEPAPAGHAKNVWCEIPSPDLREGL
ncbi:MEDS domain-containing protein [Nocardia sp. GTS18]|uniref:MEDS domain-containing protein n=1 Tax=Nocardia sp. GTS18 TaxID=1778064 RepID=UPI0015EF4505|nr:MEDS domain-containing protein [Nocardia sp. GTS18]